MPNQMTSKEIRAALKNNCLNVYLYCARQDYEAYRIIDARTTNIARAPFTIAQLHNPNLLPFSLTHTTL